MRTRLPFRNGDPSTLMPATRRRRAATNAVSISFGVPAKAACDTRPSERAAASIDSTTAALCTPESPRFSTALPLGSNSASSSRRLTFSGVPRKLTPVSLPPGRPSWAAKPDPTASPSKATMGTSGSASSTACVACGPEVTITTGLVVASCPAIWKTFRAATGPARVDHDVALLYVALGAQRVDQPLLHRRATRGAADAQHADASWRLAGLRKRARQHERGQTGEREPALPQ